jgi:hypothetical protein
LPSDWEEKYQIELLEDQVLHARLKEKQEADTAIAAILVFAMVRNKSTATDLGRDLDNVSAKLGSDWSSSTKSEENVEIGSDKHGKDPAGFSVMSPRQPGETAVEVKSHD